MNKLLLLLKGQIALWLSFGKVNNNIWVFSSRNNTDFNYNSKYLFLYVKEHFKQVTPLYVINDAEKRKKLQQEYGQEYFVETNTLKGMLQVLKAGVWFTSAGLPVYALGTGKRHTIVNLWHGVPLKKIALMEEHMSGFTKLYFRKVFSENYRYVLTTSEHLVSTMRESFAVSEDKIKVWGQPRNDVLLDGAQQTKRLSDFIDVPEYDKAILYAPTYRDNGETRWFPFEDFDGEKLQRYLQENHILLCLRAHAEESVAKELCKYDNIINLSSDVIDDITGNLYLFDMLITDYSSIYIDYLLLNRPILFLPYDKQEYLASRGMNFEYDKVTPGAKPITFVAFLDVIQRDLRDDLLIEERGKVNDFFNKIKKPCSKKICEKIYAEVSIGGYKN